MTKSSNRDGTESPALSAEPECSAGAAAATRPWWRGRRQKAAPDIVPPFEFDEVTVAALQSGMKSGNFTARSIAEKYLARIDAIDKHGPAVNAVIELNPDALAIADALDRERQSARAARTAARHSGSDQRQYRYARPDANHGRLAGAGGIGAAQGLLCGQEAARRRRGDSGQDQLERVGQYPLLALHQRLERARRADSQSLRAGSQS